MIELKLKKGRRGRQKPYCFMYSIHCGKCGGAVRIRSIRNFKVIPSVEGADITFQCDECRLRWNVSQAKTRKIVRPYGPKAEDPNEPI